MKSKMNWLMLLGNFALDYAPIVATIVLATIASLASIRKSISMDEMLQWILIVLALLATTQLIDRFRIFRSFDNKIDQLLDRLLWKKSPLIQHGDRIFLSSIAKDATTIDILAWSGITLFKTEEDFLLRKVAENCKIRMIILNPESKAAEVIMDNSRYKELIPDVKNMIHRYRALLEASNINPSQFELRLTSWLPPHGMIVVNAAKKNGILSVGFHPSYLPLPQDSRRYIVLNTQESPDDFYYYVNQYESLWKISQGVSID